MSVTAMYCQASIILCSLKLAEVISVGWLICFMPIIIGFTVEITIALLIIVILGSRY